MKETNKEEQDGNEQSQKEELRYDDLEEEKDEKEKTTTKYDEENCERNKTINALHTDELIAIAFLSLTVVGLLVFGIVMLVKKSKKGNKN